MQTDLRAIWLSTIGFNYFLSWNPTMEQAFGLNIPRTLEDVCDPERLALIVYDLQVGIVNQIKNGHEITDRVLKVLEAARVAEIRVFHFVNGGL